MDSQAAITLPGTPGLDTVDSGTASSAGSVLASPSPSPSTVTPRPAPKKKARCRYFATRNGCRAGDACPFSHDPLTANDHQTEVQAPKGKSQQRPIVSKDVVSNEVLGAPQQARRYDPGPVATSRLVPKPISQTQIEDPREFQVRQLRRRYSPTEKTEDNGSTFIFKMPPSDPDFPFDIVALECALHVPLAYPKVGKPSLRVTNKEMGRGYQINVEKGFDALIEKSPQATLLTLMTALDKQLEALLTEQKAETVKIMPNIAPGTRDRRHESPASVPQITKDSPEEPASVQRIQHYTQEQLENARSRRELETRQLEARLGRLPLFGKSSDGIVYTVPIEPRKPGDLPVPLMLAKKVNLFVPLLYPLQCCRIEIQDVTRDAAANTENSFDVRAKQVPETTLMGQINYLSQNMHIMTAKTVLKSSTEVPNVPSVESLQLEDAPTLQVAPTSQTEEYRSHIQLIPRPPEWALNDAANEHDDTDYSDSYDSGDESADEAGEENTDIVPESSSAAPERGILLSFPFLELYGVELLELVSLCITIKCERCKDFMDISNLRTSAARSESCKKCTSTLSIGYRRELMHANSVRAGYIDLDGCSVVDMLPSNFIPTCSECSTPYTSPGIVSVRGESSMATCRECHRKMTFKIPEVKFLLVSAAAVRANRAPPRKKTKENLGIVAGQELPRRGRCKHYSKSYRWFRFSCCSKVFPCDKCHDAEGDHPNEHANRMICGFCSREQNYRPEDCGLCHADLTKKQGSGFWEGGKGTRDKTRMSRKDPRKYKRRPGGKLKT